MSVPDIDIETIKDALSEQGDLDLKIVNENKTFDIVQHALAGTVQNVQVKGEMQGPGVATRLVQLSDAAEPLLAAAFLSGNSKLRDPQQGDVHAELGVGAGPHHNPYAVLHDEASFTSFWKYWFKLEHMVAKSRSKDAGATWGAMAKMFPDDLRDAVDDAGKADYAMSLAMQQAVECSALVRECIKRWGLPTNPYTLWHKWTDVVQARIKEQKRSGSGTAADDIVLPRAVQRFMPTTKEGHLQPLFSTEYYTYQGLLNERMRVPETDASAADVVRSLVDDKRVPASIRPPAHLAKEGSSVSSYARLITAREDSQAPANPTWYIAPARMHVNEDTHKLKRHYSAAESGQQVRLNPVPCIFVAGGLFADDEGRIGASVDVGSYVLATNQAKEFAGLSPINCDAYGLSCCPVPVPLLVRRREGLPAAGLIPNVLTMAPPSDDVIKSHAAGCVNTGARATTGCWQADILDDVTGKARADAMLEIIRKGHGDMPGQVLVWTLRCPTSPPQDLLAKADSIIAPCDQCNEYLVQTADSDDGKISLTHIGVHTLKNLIKAYINATRTQAKLQDERVSDEDAMVMEGIVQNLATGERSLRSLLSNNMLISHCTDGFGEQTMVQLAKRGYEIVDTPKTKEELLAELRKAQA